MKYKIGIFGSSAGDLDAILPKAHELGKVLANANVTILTGAAQGLPYEIASTAAKHGAEVWGYSQFISTQIEKDTIPTLDFSVFTKIFYMGISFTGPANSCSIKGDDEVSCKCV